MDWKLKKAVNAKFDMAALLRQMGADIPMVPCTLACPFHNDNRKSAKLFEDNKMYCWTEQRMFGPYDALKALGVSDNKIQRMLMDVGIKASEIEEKKVEIDKEAATALRKRFLLGQIEFQDYLEEVYKLI